MFGPSGRTGPTRQGESLTTQSHAWVAGLVRQGALSVPTRADSAPDFSPGFPARSKPFLNSAPATLP